MGGGGLGLVGRLPLCWETEGVQQAGRLFTGPPNPFLKSHRITQTEIEPAD